MGAAFAQEVAPDEMVLEALPEHVLATMESRDQWFAALPAGNGPALEFFFVDIQRWEPGQTVKVAFLGGTDALHKEIADATQSITSNCNIKLDFGLDASGAYRKWTTSDSQYAAEIRVSFDQPGNFSLVGQDSVSPNIGSPLESVGGRPNQRSLNLGGYAAPLSSERKKTVRHEFLHALAFKHEHQSPLGGCDSQFRWENDPGYVQTQGPQGQFVNDASGKRPGIYTYLSGFPNFWGRAKVDHNLRQAPSTSGATAGTFDRASIMLYRFPGLFYVSDPNPCAPFGGTDDLSAGDIQGLKQLYPSEAPAVAALAERSAKLIESVREAPGLEQSQKVRVLESLEQ